MPTKTTTARILYADSERCADQFYLTGLFVPDAFLTLQVGKKSYGVFNALEINRARTSSKLSEVLSLEELHAQLCQEGVANPQPADIVAYLSDQIGFDEVIVPHDFPVGLANEISRRALEVSIAEEGFFPKRAIKTEAEADAIESANKACAAGFRTAKAILKEADIRGRYLYWNGKKLTSEILRAKIDASVMEAGAMPNNTIVAGGEQACDPHERGYGPLEAHKLIIIDIFPRSMSTGYHGDMTRTFLKGRASEAQKKLVKAVLEAQQNALSEIKAGVSGKRIHQNIDKLFEQNGYITDRSANPPCGFFHGTGHGLGLEVHETPRVNSSSGKLKKGHVVTIEPGLYYPGLGGCRIEDVVHVTAGGARILSKSPYSWQIR